MGSVGSKSSTVTEEMTEAQWGENNEKISQGFSEWLDSKERKPFRADDFNIFEKMTLDEVRKWLKPDSEKGFSYNSDDEVPEDTWYYVGYDTGDVLMLEPGDSLKGVPRSGILFCIQENENTTVVYAKRGSNDISIYNDAKYSDYNDIWRWDIANAKSWRYHNNKLNR